MAPEGKELGELRSSKKPVCLEQNVHRELRGATCTPQPRSRRKTKPPPERALGPEHLCLPSLRQVGKSHLGAAWEVGQKAQAELGPGVAAASAGAWMRMRGRHPVTAHHRLPLELGGGGVSWRNVLKTNPENVIKLPPNQWRPQTVGRRGRRNPLWKCTGSSLERTERTQTRVPEMSQNTQGIISETY